ncbi:MAG: hypothetical protein ACR2OV_15965 [Hyphomicrobiaceae bacterium]
MTGAMFTTGQIMTLRVAIESFAFDLKENGLGDDEHGKAMTEAYLARIAEIRLILDQISEAA